MAAPNVLPLFDPCQLVWQGKQFGEPSGARTKQIRRYSREPPKLLHLPDKLAGVEERDGMRMLSSHPNCFTCRTRRQGSCAMRVRTAPLTLPLSLRFRFSTTACPSLTQC